MYQTGKKCSNLSHSRLDPGSSNHLRCDFHLHYYDFCHCIWLPVFKKEDFKYLYQQDHRPVGAKCTRFMGFPCSGLKIIL
jgi:hypothetical protein